MAPPPGSFQTVSDWIVAPDARSDVPPQPSACGADAGKSVCCCPSLTASAEPLSPAATVTETPSPPASVRICSICVRACALQASSDSPQLTETTDGLWVESWTAVDTASMNPWSVLGAK